MDPIALATITSALTLLSTEVAKGAAGEAGKQLWARIQSMLGWAKDPSPPELSVEIARKLATTPELASKIVELLQGHAHSVPQASSLVGHIDAQKVVVASEFNVSGDFIM
jgi:hypothetical protein